MYMEGENLLFHIIHCHKINESPTFESSPRFKMPFYSMIYSTGNIDTKERVPAWIMK